MHVLPIHSPCIPPQEGAHRLQKLRQSKAAVEANKKKSLGAPKGIYSHDRFIWELGI